MVWVLSLAVLPSALMGCVGGVEVADPVTQGEGTLAVPAERLDETWVVALATEEALGPYASEPGWVSLVMKRDVAAATRQLGAKGGIAAARAHADAAAVFRQAAMISANSLVEVYGKTPEPTDPIGAAHLVSVGFVLRGEPEEAKKAAAALDGATDDPTLSWHEPWKGIIAGTSAWPVELSSLPLELPEPTPGGWPELPVPPHYAMPERGGSEASRTMGDPGALVALALWHDAAARAAAGDQYGLVESYRSGYRLPVEPPVAPAGDLPMELLFGSDLLVPGDASFMADLHGSKGVVAVEAHADTSLLAWLARESRVEGKIDAERAIDLVSELRTGLVERASARTDGTVQGHHRQFADIAFVGALRSLALVAEVEGDREASGLLRINALEHSDKATACPVGLLALAAWDASNRYPLRALDILHGQASRYPALEIARYGLDVLGLRVNDERTGETPGM